jgi:hypothetical protein
MRRKPETNMAGEGSKKKRGFRPLYKTLPRSKYVRNSNIASAIWSGG